MDTVIYSATPLKAISGSLFIIAISFILGLVSLLPALFTRREKVFKRAATGCIGIVLLLAGIGVSLSTYNTYQNGDKTVRVRILEKTENLVKCNESYCTEYGVDAADGEKHYTFGLSEETWDLVEVNACYLFTYYPLKPLLADYLQEENSSPSLYETTGDITLIKKVGC